MTDETPNQRKWRELRERQEAKAAKLDKLMRAPYALGKRQRKQMRRLISEDRNADRIDGYDRDDLGLSPDF